MLYQDADDQILEQDIFTDFNEAERVGSTDQVRIGLRVRVRIHPAEGDEGPYPVFDPVEAA